MHSLSNFVLVHELVAALMSVKSKMNDELKVMSGWDINSVDPCTWNMVACSPQGFVTSLYDFFYYDCLSPFNLLFIFTIKLLCLIL